MSGPPNMVGSAPATTPASPAGAATFNREKTPFPWFGGKADAAPAVWARTVTEWFREGWIKGGMGSDAHRERLWLSPHCERPGTEPQMGLWE